ncbi:MAG: hypothetical protein WBN66_10280 [Smithella sp.]
MAKTVISESELDAVTAQQGVTIDFTGTSYTYSTISGNVMVTNWAPSLFAWGDANGFGSTYTSSGWVGVSNITMSAASNVIMYNVMTLDVGSSGTATKLNIGLPSVFIHPLTTDAMIKLGANQLLGSSSQILGSIYNDQFAVIVNPFGSGALGPSFQGSLMIGNHSSTNQQGVEMTFNNFYLGIPSVAIDMSWGDADGFTGSGSAGYMGMSDYIHYNANMFGAIGTSMMLVSMSGTQSIDVGSSGTLTKLSIVLPTTTINPNFGLTGTNATITAPLAMSTAKTLTNPQVLGTAYIEGFQPTTQGSFCLFAH